MNNKLKIDSLLTKLQNWPMNKNSTLIYQFNSKKHFEPIVFDLIQFLEDEAELKQKLNFFKKMSLKAPKIRVLSH